ncbi:hypothetical protein C8R45DRAFT_965150 [Mycena sanguinolenta]|nr:hypothetical protein C8R45DRAFT_965150 [Mycena sanguinolenta]
MRCSGVHRPFPSVSHLRICAFFHLLSVLHHFLYTLCLSPSMGKPKGPKNGERCTWTDRCDAVLVEGLRKAKELGYQSDSGWKPVTWTFVEPLLKDTPGAPKTPLKIQDHYGSLKAAFLIVQTLRELSGFSWDDGRKMVSATDEVWDAYLKRHPTAKKWRKTPFLLYDDISFLVDGIVATGAGAFHAGGSSQVNTDSQSTSQAGGSSQQNTNSHT